MIHGSDQTDMRATESHPASSSLLLLRIVGICPRAAQGSDGTKTVSSWSGMIEPLLRRTGPGFP